MAPRLQTFYPNIYISSTPEIMPAWWFTSTPLNHEELPESAFVTIFWWGAINGIVNCSFIIASNDQNKQLIETWTNAEPHACNPKLMFQADSNTMTIRQNHVIQFTAICDWLWRVMWLWCDSLHFVSLLHEQVLHHHLANWIDYILDILWLSCTK